MTIIHKALEALRNWKWVFGKKDHGDPMDWAWQDHPFYTSGDNEAARRNQKLADLARYIENARRLVEKRKGQKKKTSDVLAAIVQAQTERLQIETGLRVFRGGAWVLKDGE